MISLDYQQIVRNYQQNGKWRRQKYPGGLYGLHLEIMDFYDWIKPTNEEYIMRYHVVNRYEFLFSTKIHNNLVLFEDYKFREVDNIRVIDEIREIHKV